MEKDLLAEDIKKAQRICDELRSGINNSFEELIREKNKYFKIFASKRLYQPELADELLNDFWLSLKSMETICNYQGKQGSSLNNYLMKALIYRIIDRNRKKPEKTVSIESISYEDTPESRLISSEKQSILNEALLILGNVSPKDASLIQMYLDDKDYEEMVKIQLSGQKIDGEVLRRRYDAVRKQFTRSKTGSLARFKRIVQLILERKSLTFKDLLE